LQISPQIASLTKERSLYELIRPAFSWQNNVMDVIIFEILFIGSLILVNGIFSMTEIAVVSARRVRLDQAAARGSAGAARAVQLKENPDRFLSTVQIGITLVGILSGAFGGALLSDNMADVVRQVPVLEPYAVSIGFGIVIVVITYFSLVIGELVPKNIALNRPETIASLFSRPMHLVSRFTAPAVALLSLSTRLILKVLRIHESQDAAITEEEIKAHIAHGARTGVLDEAEQELIESVIKLDDQRITALMTPRVKIVWLDLDDNVETNRKKLIDSQYSRLPVCRGQLDEVVGIVKARELLGHVLAGGDLDLEQLVKQPVFVPESATALELLEIFKTSSTHVALVIDEFGAIVGLVTINDVLEAIVGDLPVGGIVDLSVVIRDDGSMLVDGHLSIPDLKDILEIADFPEEERDAYQTLGGFVLTRLERLPVVGNKFEWEGWTFEVVDMDGRRVDKVLVSRETDQR
jgi:putative hemolysin